MPARVGRRDEDAEKDTEKDGEEGAKRSRAGAGAPHPVRVSVAMKRAHAEMSSAATVGLLLGHCAGLTASTNGCAAEQVGQDDAAGPRGQEGQVEVRLGLLPAPPAPPLAGCVR